MLRTKTANLTPEQRSNLNKYIEEQYPNLPQFKPKSSSTWKTQAQLEDSCTNYTPLCAESRAIPVMNRQSNSLYAPLDELIQVDKRYNKTRKNGQENRRNHKVHNPVNNVNKIPKNTKTQKNKDKNKKTKKEVPEDEIEISLMYDALDALFDRDVAFYDQLSLEDLTTLKNHIKVDPGHKHRYPRFSIESLKTVQAHVTWQVWIRKEETYKQNKAFKKEKENELNAQSGKIKDLSNILTAAPEIIKEVNKTVPLIDQSVNNMHAVADKVENITTNVDACIEKAVNALESECLASRLDDLKILTSTLPEMSKVTTSLENTMNTLKDSLDLFCDGKNAAVESLIEKFASMTRFIAKLLLTGILVYRTKDVATRALLVGSLALDTPLLSKCLHLFAEWIGFATKPTELPEAQTLNSQQAENMFTTFISCFVSIFSKRTISEMQLDKTRFARVTGALRFITSMPDLIGKLGDMFTIAIGFVYETVTGRPLVENDTLGMYEEVKNFCTESIKLTNTLTLDAIKESEPRREIKRLQAKKVELHNALIDAKYAKMPLSLFTRCCNIVNAAHQQVLAYEKIDHGRTPPLVIDLCGRPGVGKSSVVEMVVCDLLTLLDRKYDGQSTYNRNKSDDFWSGYDQQFAVLIDDYLQIDNIEMKQKMVSELFAIMAANPYSLNMAHLEEKGKYFDSELVFLTSNCLPNEVYSYKQSFGLQSNEAFAGRRDMLLQVDIHPTHGKDAVSWTRDKLIFRFLDVYTAQPISKWLSYGAIMAVVEQEHRRKRIECANIIKFLMQNEQRKTKQDIRKMAYVPLGHFKEFGNMQRSDPSSYPINMMAKVLQALPQYDKVSQQLLDVQAQPFDPKQDTVESQMKKGKEKDPKFYFKERPRSEWKMNFDAQKLKETQEAVKEKYHFEDIESDPTKPIDQAERRQKILIEDQIMETMYKNNDMESLEQIYEAAKEHLRVDFSVLPGGVVHSIVSDGDDKNEQNLHGPYPQLDDERTPEEKTKTEQMKEFFSNKLEKCKDRASKFTECGPVQSIIKKLTEIRQDSAQAFDKLKVWYEDLDPTHKIFKIACISVVTAVGLIGVVKYFFSKDEQIEEPTKKMPTLTTDSEPSYKQESQAKASNHKGMQTGRTNTGRVREFVRRSIQRDRSGYQGEVHGTTSKVYNQTLYKLKAHDGDILKELNQMRGSVLNCNKNLDDIVETQSGDILERMMNNSAEFKAGTHIIQATFIGSTIALTAAHFVQYILDNKDNFSIKYGEHKQWNIIPKGSYLISMIKEIDTALIVFLKEAKIPEFKNLTKFIATDESYPNDLDSGITIAGYKSSSFASQAILKMDFNYTDNGEVRVNPLGVFCWIGSVSGSCGRLYKDNATRNLRPIVAMHIAGNSVCSFGTQITVELIDFLMSKIITAQAGEEEHTVHPDIINSVKGNKVLGYLTGESVVRMSPHSQLEPSIIFDNSVNTTVPALLGPKKNPDGVIVKPMEEALKKKLAPSHYIEDPDFDRVVDIFIDSMPTLIRPRMLSLDEAINGVQYSNLIRPVELKTSSGYPYTTSAGKKEFGIQSSGKKSFFDMDEHGHRTPTALFMERYEAAFEEVATTGNRTCYVQDCLKDETLNPSKVYVDKEDGRYWIGKTRIMGPVPIEDLIIERQIFGAFYMNILKWREQMGFCDVGINPHSMDIDLMIRNLMPSTNEDDLVCIDGDISGLDGGIKEGACLAFEKIVESYYDLSEDETVEYAVIREAYNRALARECKHVCGDVVYQTCSNPSGRFLTTVFNSCITMLGIMLAAYKKTKDVDFTRSLLTKARVYGDDHIVVFHKNNAPINMFDVRDAFQIMGLKYTSINKETELKAFDSFKDMKYLSRYFIKDENGLYHAALEKDTIEQIGQWKPKNLANKPFVESIINSMMFEAFHWGPAYFAERKLFVRKLLNSINFPQTFVYTYNDLYALFRDITPARGIVNIQINYDNQIESQSGRYNSDDEDYLGSRTEEEIRHERNRRRVQRAIWRSLEHYYLFTVKRPRDERC